MIALHQKGFVTSGRVGKAQRAHAELNQSEWLITPQCTMPVAPYAG